MITIISATNRTNSNSMVLAHFYKSILDKTGVPSQVMDLTDLPQDFIFSALYDNSGSNRQFNAVTERMRGSEKFVFIVPEYNGSFPGVLKAFIDGLSYPSPFSGKKAALVGLGSGIMGGSLALSHLTDILNYVGMHVLALKIKLPKIEDKLSADGQISDKFLSGLIEKQARQLLDF